MHVNPVVSDGQWTIGYDADGVAGQWPGNMAETIDAGDFMSARAETLFSDGSENWEAYENGDEIVWRLRQHGDR